MRDSERERARVLEGGDSSKAYGYVDCVSDNSVSAVVEHCTQTTRAANRKRIVFFLLLLNNPFTD